MGQVTLKKDIYCAQSEADGNIQITCINEPLMDIKIHGVSELLSNEQLREVGIALLDAAEKNPIFGSEIKSQKKAWLSGGCQTDAFTVKRHL